MQDKMLVRMIGEVEVYQFMNDIEEFVEYYKANSDTFQIFEIANLRDIEITPLGTGYSVYDMILQNSGDHFWLLKDEETGTYEPVESMEEAERLRTYLANDEDDQQPADETS